ncbi:MAG: hypothetical protein K2K44_11595 [Oscillospiraceae bacterium]|nr:hypothetical protein [Oscillospiraceae bacterium]
MKKIFLTLITVCIFTFAGCEKTADEIVDEISDTTVCETVSESKTEITEALETATASSAEVTTTNSAAETSENVSQTTSEATASQAVPKTTSANNLAAGKFPVGEWIESRSYIYNFDDKGNVSIDTGFHTLNGTYEYSGNDFKIKLSSGWGDPYTYDFTVRFEDGYTALEYKGCPENKYMAFEPTGLLTGYSSALYYADEFRLTPYRGGLKNVTSLSEIQGLWQYYYSDSEPDNEIWIFCGDNIALLGNSDFDKFPETDENGYTIIDEDYGIAVDYEDGKGEHMIYAQDLFRIYGDTLYLCQSTQDAQIFKKYKPEPVPKDFLDGTILSGGFSGEFLDGYFIEMKNGMGTVYVDDSKAELKINGNKLTVTIDGETRTFDCYYLPNEDDNDTKKLCIVDMEALKNGEEDFYGYFILRKK